MSKLYNKITGTTADGNCPFCNKLGYHSIRGTYAQDTFTCYMCGVYFTLDAEVVTFFRGGDFIEIHFHAPDEGYFMWGEYFPETQSIKIVHPTINEILDIDPNTFGYTVKRLKKLYAFS